MGGTIAMVAIIAMVATTCYRAHPVEMILYITQSKEEAHCRPNGHRSREDGDHLPQ